MVNHDCKKCYTRVFQRADEKTTIWTCTCLICGKQWEEAIDV